MNTNLSKILCAVDFSKFSKPLIDTAAFLAQTFGSHLTVFHALGFRRTPLQEEADCRPGADMTEQASDACVRIDALMAERQVPWNTAVRCGDAVDTIVKYSEANDIGMVVAASYGLSGLKRFLLGTVVEALSRTLTRPLMVVRPSRKKRAAQIVGPLRLKNVLICCDLSSSTLALYPYAEKFARYFDAKLHIVHAMDTPVQEDLVDPTTGPYAEVQHRLQRRILERLRSQVPSDFRQGVDVTAAVIAGNPYDSLRDYATANAIDLIIVGVRPRGSFQKILVGSTTESMVRGAPCNVLTIPCSAGGK